MKSVELPPTQTSVTFIMDIPDMYPLKDKLQETLQFTVDSEKVGTNLYTVISFIAETFPRWR